MANEYAELEELKEMRSITGTSQDDALQRALLRASRAIDRRCSRRFYLDPSATARRFSAFGRTIRRGSVGEALLVDDIGSEAEIVVNVGGADVSADRLTYGPSNAIAAGNAITDITYASWYGGDIFITARWGWPEIPESITEATLLLANRRYMRKDSPEGVSGWSQEGAIQVSRYDPDIEDLLAPFVIEGFGS